jgi:anti-anti-sigma factor
MSKIVYVEAAIQAAHTASVRIVGELTFESVAEAREQLRALIHAGCRQLVVDISRLDFCDSTGLGLLLQLRAELNDDGGGLELRGAQGQPRRILDVTGAHVLFTVAERKRSSGSSAPASPATSGGRMVSAGE